MSRRSDRRQRRQEKRNKNKKEYTIEDIASNDALYKSYKKSCKTIMFKESVQRYRLNLLFKNYESKQKLKAGKDVRQGLISFKRSDRGKTRDIDSIHFAERVIQTALCTNVLQPGFFHKMIKENSASQKGKGTVFASKLFEQHFREFLRKYKAGYILLGDFSKYFENIDQETVINFYKENIKDPILQQLCINFVTIYKKGLGLGSEVSQFNAIMYLNEVDHWIKSKYKYFGRYMDDFYIIHHNKEELEQTLSKLLEMFTELKVVVNTKKTKIIPITQPFTFLKTRYLFIDGKLVKKPHRSCITRQRRRLKAQYRLFLKGVLQKIHIDRSFISWVGSMKRRHARKTIFEMKKYYNQALKGENKWS